MKDAKLQVSLIDNKGKIYSAETATTAELVGAIKNLIAELSKRKLGANAEPVDIIKGLLIRIAE